MVKDSPADVERVLGRYRSTVDVYAQKAHGAVQGGNEHAAREAYTWMEQQQRDLEEQRKRPRTVLTERTMAHGNRVVADTASTGYLVEARLEYLNPEMKRIEVEMRRKGWLPKK
jgi:hypothetical protein